MTGFGSRTLRVTTRINAPTSRVWREVANLATHNEWMDDAKEIRFQGTRRSGKGVTFDVLTRIWKFEVDDHIVVTEWQEPDRIVIAHDGAVQGNGTFTLTPTAGGTEFAWEEDLLFPFYMGGPLGELATRPLVKRIWTKNLASLKDRIEMKRDINPITFFKELGITMNTTGKPGSFSVDLASPSVSERNYATNASSGFAARLAAYDRWISEHP
jgi:uncharacterized protein YndB with AHSA1/START domain